MGPDFVWPASYEWFLNLRHCFKNKNKEESVTESICGPTKLKIFPTWRFIGKG